MIDTRTAEEFAEDVAGLEEAEINWHLRNGWQEVAANLKPEDLECLACGIAEDADLAWEKIKETGKGSYSHNWEDQISDLCDSFIQAMRDRLTEAGYEIVKKKGD